MTESFDPKTIHRPVSRCSSCDTETEFYNEWMSPTGEIKVVCWNCLMRSEKNFNTKKGFVRASRSGTIPR